MSDLIVKRYEPSGETLRRFMKSDARVRLLIGPLGSGKSSCAVAELLRRSMMQAKAPDGIRYVKILVVRDTFTELRMSTIPTFNQYFPFTHADKVTNDSPITLKSRLGDLDLEVHFMALDREEDAKKVLSTEYTMAWIDECRFTPKFLFDAIFGRLGRFPNKMLGGCTWSGILLTTNPFDEGHWLYLTAIKDKPPIWEVFIQPSGLSDKAENIQNLPKNYYQDMVHGKDPDWIRVNIHGEFGYVIEGKPVYEHQYRDHYHCAKSEIEPNPRYGLAIGADFGILTSAAVIGQKLSDGRLLILDEFVSDNIGIQKFAALLSSFVAQNYPEFDVVGAWGDPAGSIRSMSDERTALEIMSEHTRWKWRPAPGTNNITERLESVRYLLNTNTGAEPNLLISPRCKTLRAAMVNKYHFKFARTGNGSVANENPEKNHPWSDIADSLAYLTLGLGGVDTILNKQKRDRKLQIKRYDTGTRSVFDSRPWKKSIFD